MPMVRMSSGSIVAMFMPLEPPMAPAIIMIIIIMPMPPPAMPPCPFIAIIIIAIIGSIEVHEEALLMALTSL